MKVVKKAKKNGSPEKEILLKAVERSAQIEGLSLQSAQSNFKVIAELKKHGKNFSL